jgi:hypothetical protein
MPVWPFLRKASISAYFPAFGQTGHKGQIAAGGKCTGHATGLIADHQTGTVGIHIVQASAMKSTISPLMAFILV